MQTRSEEEWKSLVFRAYMALLLGINRILIQYDECEAKSSIGLCWEEGGREMKSTWDALGQTRRRVLHMKWLWETNYLMPWEFCFRVSFEL